MAAAVDIVLADAQGTPVNHTFIPLGPDDNNVWWFEDQSASSPIGYNRISVEFRRPLNGAQGEDSSKRMSRVKVGVHTPKLETLSNSTVSGIIPAPTVSYIARCNIEFIIPERATLQDRKDLRKYVSNVVNSANIYNAVETLQGLW